MPKCLENIPYYILERIINEDKCQNVKKIILIIFLKEKLTFSIACYHFDLINIDYFSQFPELNIFQDKCPYVITKSVSIQVSLEMKADNKVRAETRKTLNKKHLKGRLC